MDDCEFCNGEFEHTTIKKYDNWSLELFLNQYYLGRCLIKLNRHVEDVNKIDKEEQKEIFEKIMPELKEALDSLFEPDLYNYATLGNDCRHLHFHVIPRYAEEREFNGKTYVDENWNQHYLGYPSDFSIGDEDLEKLEAQIRSELEQN